MRPVAAGRGNSRRSRGSGLLVPFLVVLLIGPLALPRLGAAADVNERSAKAAQLKQLRARIEGLRKLLDVTQGRKDIARVELRKVEEKIGQVAGALRGVETDIARQGRRLDELHARRTSLRKGLAKDRGILARQVRASYIMGRQEHLKILLNQGDPASVQRALVYYDYLNRSRAARIRAALEQLQQLRQVEAEISQKQQVLQVLQARHEQQQHVLQQSRAARKKVLTALEHKIQDKDRRLKRMLRDERELKRVLQVLEQALSDIPMEPQFTRPFASLKGKLPWPARGRVVVRYGSPRGVGKLRWRGVVIAAPTGTKVHAVSHGRVAFADWLRGYGLLLIIDHGNGYMSLYAHNQSLYKEVGEWVQRGDVIASVGDSGGQASSGLYFEIRRQGTTVNPVAWCRPARGTLVGLSR